MELASSNGNVLSLTIDGYQFPATSGAGDRDWDANWLMISGRVKSGDQHWTFRDPCLTTWEAHELGDWLRGVLSGAIEAAPYEDDNEVRLEMFTEPNVALNLASRGDGAAEVRVYLSLEALPRTMADISIFEYFVELTLTDDEIASAVREWDAELRAFPVRA